MKTFEYTETDYSLKIHQRGTGARTQWNLEICTPQGTKKRPNICAATKPRKLAPAYADVVRKVGKSPDDYVLFCGEIIRKGAEKMLLEWAAESHNILMAEHEAEEKKLNEKIPGLVELQAAYEAEEKYHNEFSRRMEDENLSSFIPASPRPTSAEVAAKYPIAALYLRAESYSYAAHDAKAAAGRRAKALVLAGNLDGAKVALDTWVDGLDID